MLSDKLPIYLIKLGGSLITDKNKLHTFNTELIKHFFKELKIFYSQTKTHLIFGSGAGGSTHYLASRYQTLQGIAGKSGLRGAVLVKQSALKYHLKVLNLGVQAGLPLFSFSASSLLSAKEASVDSHNLTPLLYSLKKNFVPHLYGDVIFSQKKGWTIFSTEKIFTVLVKHLQTLGFFKIKVFLLADTSEVYIGNGQTIKAKDLVFPQKAKLTKVVV